MAIDKGIQAAIAKLDERIANLTALRDGLLAEFGQEDAATAAPAEAAPAQRRRAHGRRSRRRRQPPQESGRRNTVIAFLRQNGPAMRRQIVSGTGIPVGTVSYVLNDKQTFAHLEDGRWTLVG